MTTGEKIKSIRNAQGLTQKELGQLSGLSEISIRKYEANDRTPKKPQLSKLADALGVSINALVDDEIISQEYMTTGDIAALISLLDERVGLKFFGERDENGRLSPEAMSFALSHGSVNEVIADWEQLRHKYYSKVMALHGREPTVAEQYDLNAMKKHLDNFTHNMAYMFTSPLDEADGKDSGQ